MKYKVNNLKKQKIQYRLEHDPKEEGPIEDGPEAIEINEPIEIDDTNETHTYFQTKTKGEYKMKTGRKIVYSCSDDYIEVPGGTESVTWTDDEGTTYEVDISDLQEYDGDDGEIQYTKGRSNNLTMSLVKKKKKAPKIYCQFPQMLIGRNYQRIR